MSRPRWRLILNGKSVDNDEVRSAVGEWRRRGHGVEVRVTWEDGDAARYVGEAVADGVDTVIAAGGDGTVGEVAGALAAHEGHEPQRLPSLGVVPLGTANDFATAAALPVLPAEAMALIAATAPCPVDMLRVGMEQQLRWCINVASGGFGTQVTVETDEGLKKMLGGLAYLITGMAKLGRIEPLRARLRGPDFAWEGEFIALGLGNGRQAGGGQALCPEALIDDGLLDLTVVPELSGELAATLGRLVTGGTQAVLEAAAVRARLPWVEIESPAPMVLNLDGEPQQAHVFRIDCVPGRVRMHLPDDSPLRGAVQRQTGALAVK